LKKYKKNEQQTKSEKPQKLSKKLEEMKAGFLYYPVTGVISESTPDGKRLQRAHVFEYPYNTTKYTLEDFKKTEAWQYYKRSKEYKEYKIRPSKAWMFAKTKAQDNIANLVNQLCPDKVKRFIDCYKNIGESTKKQSKIFILCGRGGVGKTTLGEFIFENMKRKGHMIYSCGIATTYRDSERINLKETIIPLIKKEEPSLIILDGAECLGQRTINMICDFAKKYPNMLFILIASTYYSGLTKLEKKIGNMYPYKKIKIFLPDLNARKEIIKCYLEDKKKRSVYPIEENSLYLVGVFKNS
jgi:hypothetical protein